MLVHLTQATRQLVTLLHTEAGSAAVYRRGPLERLHRDAITMSAHFVGQHKTYEPIGQALFGLEPSLPSF